MLSLNAVECIWEFSQRMIFKKSQSKSSHHISQSSSSTIPQTLNASPLAPQKSALKKVSSFPKSDSITKTSTGRRLSFADDENGKSLVQIQLYDSRSSNNSSELVQNKASGSRSTTSSLCIIS